MTYRKHWGYGAPVAVSLLLPSVATMLKNNPFPVAI